MNVSLGRQPGPVRVAHVAPGLDMGGLEKLLVEFARHADRRRFALHFVSLGARGLLADEIASLSWPVTALGTPDGLRPGLVPRLVRLFRRERIDVVHTHDDRPLLYGTCAARLAGVRRVIHTRHGESLALSRRQGLLVRLAARAVDRFVCVSRAGADRALRQGVDARKVGSIWNGIDLERFAPGGGAGAGPVVCVARLSPEKDLATLVRAAALVAKQEPGFRLEIAGDGPCRAGLDRLVGELALDGHVRFLGQVRDVPDLLSRARLFVLPSLSEGISLTLLEAMASGLGVVATRVGGTPEVVADGRTGLLVPAADPAALSRCLLCLWTDPDEGRRLGRAGRQRVEQHFNIRHVVADYERLYLPGLVPAPC